MNGVTTEWSGYTGPPTATERSNVGVELNRVNDPSAGSPTETLLRLLLPLSNKVQKTFQDTSCFQQVHGPNNSPDCSIGRSDGRCVQRAGT